MDALLEQGQKEKWIKIVVKELGDEVELKVIDSGPGIPSEIRDQVLNPFFTTKEVGKGTGLGLSISRSLIEDHKGSLTILKNTEFTTFVIRLPKHQNERTMAS